MTISNDVKQFTGTGSFFHLQIAGIQFSATFFFLGKKIRPIKFSHEINQGYLVKISVFLLITAFFLNGASLVAQLIKNPPAMQETWVRSLGGEDSPGEENDYPLQYSYLENSVDRGAGWTTVNGVARVGPD